MKMLKFGPAALLSFVCALCSVGQTARGEDAPAVAQLLPPQTMVLVSVPDVPELKHQSADSLFGQLLADKALQPFLDELRGKIDEASGIVTEKLGLSLSELAEIPEGEVTLAVVAPKPGKLAGLLLFDYGEHGEQVEKLLEKGHAAAQEEGCEHSTQMIGDVEVNIYKIPNNDPNNPIKHVAYFSHDSYLGVATDVGALQQVLDRMSGSKRDSLATSDIYSYITEKVAVGDAEPAFVWYFDPIGLVQSAVTMIQVQNPQAGMVMGFLPILGIDKLKGIGGAAYYGIEDYDGMTKSFIYVEQPTSGLMNVFQFPAVAMTPPAWVPADAVMYSGINWDAGEAYSAIETLVDSFQGPGAFERIIDGMAESDEGPNVHIKKDIVEQLSGLIHIVGFAPAADDEAAQDFIVALGLKGEDKVKRLLAKETKSDAFNGKIREFEGTTIYEMPFEAGGLEKTLAVAVADNSLVVGTNPSQVENVIRGKSGADSLADASGYKKLAKHLPGKVSILSYQKQDTQLRSGYEQLKAMDADAIGGLDLSKLPEFEVIQKYLRPSVSYVVPDENGALQVGFTLADE
jgi:hypothetical protein